MVTVKVRETYDLHTTKNKMSVIAIHTPKPNIIKRNFPGLLMQCKAYRPVSADVVISCASVLPLDPKGVGTAEGDVAPEDVFNPILYKAISNKGMSQLEARITALSQLSGSNFDVAGQMADVEVDDFTNQTDEFNIYYGLLSNAHGWKTAHPQQGLVMRGLTPLVFDVVANVGDMGTRVTQSSTNLAGYQYPTDSGNDYGSVVPQFILGKPKSLPFINCTAFSGDRTGLVSGPEAQPPGFNISPYNAEQDVPYIHAVCGVIIIPPSRLHELFYRMTVSWEIEFSSIRPISEISSFSGLNAVGSATHYQNYSYESTKQAVTGDDSSLLENDSTMVEANVEINKVM